jgi:hypothetical protein
VNLRAKNKFSNKYIKKKKKKKKEKKNKKTKKNIIIIKSYTLSKYFYPIKKINK